MKRNILLYSLALASIVASCAKTDLPHFGGANDPNAVTISPSVALVSTRSNPLGNADAQTKFNAGDVITITDKADNEVYTYKLGTDGRWKPTDGKCLLWHDETLNISASYGESDITKVTDQSTAAGIAAADYMTFDGEVTRPSDSNELKFNMSRKRYLVIVKIDSYGDQYNPKTDKVSGLKLRFEDLSSNAVEITPLVRDANDNNVSTDGTVGYSYSAICDVAYSNIKISYQVNGAKREAVLSLSGGPKVGYSFTIKLRVGKDKIEAGDVSVGDWTDSDSWDDVSATKIPYLTFSAESEQKFSMTVNGSFTLGDGEYFEYCVGGGEWTKFTINVTDIAFGGTLGNLRLRGKSSKGTATHFIDYSKISFSTANVPVTCTGDIRTLIDYASYSTVETGNARFCYLFYNCMALTSAPELPATSLADSCYFSMFEGCTSLTTAPELKAESLAKCCYEFMFFDCTSLTEAPALPATTLAERCYQSMLSGCTSLTTAPELKAESLASYCYSSMFQSCTSLKTAPALPATTLAENCYQSMFYGCTSLETAPALPATTLAEYCYASMFNGCTALTSAPKLEATTLAIYCYSNMFNGCTALTAAPKLKAESLAKCCYEFMFFKCTSLTSAPALPAETLAESCYRSMFYGCTSLTEAPELKATKLVDNCYAAMFYDCSALSSVKMLTTNVEANQCLNDWLTNAGTSASSRTLTVANEAAYLSIVSYLPSDWQSGSATINYQI
ncbi:MAG: leucine-rich repeat protein [Bacteroidales bacterium]|nr:leucine-rich repeat protein [Bacteroidales bacterium]